MLGSGCQCVIGYSAPDTFFGNSGKLNQAISYGASSAYVGLTEFPILNDMDDAADIVKDAIGDELQAAGYHFKWDGYDCLEIQID